MPIFMAFGLLLFVLGASFTMNNWGEEDSNAHWLLITSFAVIWGTMFSGLAASLRRMIPACIVVS